MGSGSPVAELSRPRVMRTPRQVDVEITSRCNLHCRYCYYFDNPEVTYGDLPTQQWLRFFDELGRCAVMSVTLQGGEPFIREDLPELIEGIVRNGMRFAVLSNGGLINDEIAAFLAGTGRCDYVQVSVDGSCPETHDACRGKGSFEQAIAGIKALQAQKVHVTSRVTIHRHNVGDLENTARLLLEELGLDGFGTNSAEYLGSCRLNTDQVLLTTQQRALAMSALLELSKRYDGRISAQAGPLAEARMWRQMHEAYSNQSPPSPDCGRLTGCGCYMTKVNVRADGTITPCSMLAHIQLGRINQDSLKEVWQNSPALNRLRMRHTIPLSDFEFCKDCPYVPYCTGNCPGLAYSLTGEANQPSPDACLRRFLEDGGRIP